MKRFLLMFIYLSGVLNAFAATTWQTPRVPLTMTPPEGQVLIFASTSMPEASLQALYHEAARLQLPLIFRGLSRPTLPQMVSDLRGLLGMKALNQGGIAIDPVAFELFHIQTVPSFVVTHAVAVCPSTSSCPPPRYDAVSGNVSLETALTLLAEKGEAASDVAKAALLQLHHEEGLS